jgi:iron(III) transport system ATP-binding protein
MTMQLLHLEGIQVAYGRGAARRVVVDELSLSLERGAIGCLLGASGCGKTTVLRAIAGFEPVVAGAIHLDGRCLATPERALPIEQRPVGMMFQDYALFPHLSVVANVGFGLNRMTRAAREKRIGDMLVLVGLANRGGAFPHELSGGQQQRVALARALAPSPALLLLDEPFSNLDSALREHLAAELRVILKAAGTTALLVTHDQAEASAIADVIGVMSDGRIRLWAGADELYHAPADRFVAGFVGRGSIVPAGALGLAGDDDILVRPEHVTIQENGHLHARVLASAFRGPGYLLRLALPGGQVIEADLTTGPAPVAGAQLAMGVSTDHVVRFPRDDRTLG